LYRPQKKKIVVIGGNDSGLSAAGRAKRMNPELDVLVLEKSNHVSYASCSLPYLVWGKIPARDLSGYSPESIKEHRDFQVKTKTLVTAIDTFKKSLITKNIDTEITNEIKYDKLIISTGAKPIIPDELNVKAQNIFSLRAFTDAEKIEKFILENNPQKAVIIGSGYLGIEMAEAFFYRGLKVTLIEKSPRLFQDFIPEISNQIIDNIKSKGIDLILNDTVKQLMIKNGNAYKVILNNTNVELDTDIILISAGITPDVELAKNAGIPAGQSGAICVNNHQQTRRLDVFAAGDCAETKHLVTNKSTWLPLAGIASKQGRIAGTNCAGSREIFPGALGTVMIKAFDYEWGKTGLSFFEAQQAGFSPVTTVITHNNKPDYISGSCPITVGLNVDSRTGRLLGAQIAGSHDAGLRLNVVATAISARFTVNDLAFLDLGYTPMITNLWDPISVAGNVAIKNIKDNK